MTECHRCGSLLNRSGEHHECYPSSPSPRQSSPGLGKVSNLAFWQEHDRRMQELVAVHPDLSAADLASLALAPVPAVAKAA